MDANSYVTVNFTVKVQRKDVNPLENGIRQQFTLIDYRVVPDTQELYDNNAHFRELVKKAKKAKNEKEEFINKHNVSKPKK